MQTRWRSDNQLLKVVLVVGVFFFGWTGLVSHGVALAAADQSRYVADELLVQPMPGAAKEEVDRVFAGLGEATTEQLARINVRRLKVPPQALESVQAALANHPLIRYAEYNFIATGTILPDDQYYGSQWHLPKISAPQAWDVTIGSQSVPIAIIDSGVDPTHPDLSAKLIPGYNFLGQNTDTHDVYGHGTAVAGSAAASSDNLTGVAGVAWQNPIMPLVVLNSSNYATYSDIAQAITYAADHGVKVINISIGGTSSSSTLQNAVNYAWNKGAVIFASAGNDSTSAPMYPAACTNVVAVAATDSYDNFASFSNFGTWIVLSAPGWGIYTTTNGGGYGGKSGTSFSSPIAAGVAALVRSANSSLGNADVVRILKENADDLGTAGFDPYFGYGRINAYDSVLAAGGTLPPPDVTPPATAIAVPLPGSTVSGTLTVSVNASDDVGVSKVELYVDGVLYAADTTGPYSFSWNSTTHPNGTCVLKALAYDPAGNIGSSGDVGVYVENLADVTPPSITITSPAAGAQVGSKVAVSATASDNKGIGGIELYIDGKLRSSVVNQSSISWTWNTRKEATGQHTIKTVAKDAAGNLGEATVTVYK